MTQFEILEYAYDGALNAWACENEKYEKSPNWISEYHANEAWKKLQEIKDLLRAELEKVV